MGFVKDKKSGMLADEARKAAEAGWSVFTPRLNFPSSMHGMTGNIADWAQMIQTVEQGGWRLVEWSVAMDTKGRPEAYPLFRRV